MEHTCPHCGKPLPETAAFCPHCAQPVHIPKTLKLPSPRRKMLLIGLLVLAVVIAAGAGIAWYNRPYVPQEYDSAGTGEVLYTVEDTTYQLLVAWPGNRAEPAPDIYQGGLAEDVTRWPSRLYVNYQSNGAGAWDEFEPLVEEISMEVIQDEQGASDLLNVETSIRDPYPPRRCGSHNPGIQRRLRRTPGGVGAPDEKRRRDSDPSDHPCAVVPLSGL
jgi:hypothetical protein